LSHELQALAADMRLDLKAALAGTTGDLSLSALRRFAYNRG
jgi:hypothetical protein